MKYRRVSDSFPLWNLNSHFITEIKRLAPHSSFVDIIAQRCSWIEHSSSATFPKSHPVFMNNGEQRDLESRESFLMHVRVCQILNSCLSSYMGEMREIPTKGRLSKNGHRHGQALDWVRALTKTIEWTEAKGDWRQPRTQDLLRTVSWRFLCSPWLHIKHSVSLTLGPNFPCPKTSSLYQFQLEFLGK